MGNSNESPLVPIKFPTEDVITRSVNFISNKLQKTILYSICSRFFRKYGWDGEEELKEALSTLLDQNKAKQYLLQSSDEDKVVVIPFNNSVIDIWEANQLSQYPALLQNVTNTYSGGGTDIYSPVIEGLNLLSNVDTNQYNPAVILMTDGRSEGNISQLEDYYQNLNKDIPVFSIMFGDASDEQLNEISDLTRARTFDGKDNLVEAFKNAKGYN